MPEGFRTRIRGDQTKAGDVYDPSKGGLSTDREVEDRVLKHSSLFHGNRNDFTKYIKSGEILTDIKVYESVNELQLFRHTAFTYLGELLTQTDKIVYNLDNSIYTHLRKSFNYVNGELVNVDTEKVT